MGRRAHRHFIGNITPVKNINETVQITESVSKSRKLARIINETVNISENLSVSRRRTKIINETVQITESVSKSRKLARIINETVNIVESLINKVAKAANLQKTSISLYVGSTKVNLVANSD